MSCDGAIAGRRYSRRGQWTPEWWSSQPASAPCSCARSHMSARLRRSPSSQRRAETKGISSESGLTAQYSVQTAAQPPSAFMARWAACDHGFSVPKPVQWGTW
jgi:hypothetical protein